MVDNVLKYGKWEFDQEVANCFENMLSRSIPQYEEMRTLVCDIINNTYPDKYSLLDIGCSDGLMIKRLLKDECNYVAIDSSYPMIKKAKANFKNNRNVDILYCDLKYSFPDINSNIITSILTIQFIPIEHRCDILKKIYDSLSSSGIFVMVEKLTYQDNRINDMFTKIYYNMKKRNGYTEQQILAKKKSLEGVLTPLTSDANKTMLKDAGFKTVETFWKWMNFEGYLAIKE